MDEELRKKAKQCIADAKDLESHYHRTPIRVFNKYVEGITFYTTIVNKTENDFIALYKASCDLAIFCFNNSDYSKAALYFSDSISYLQQKTMDDSTYRIVTKRYIDLADTYNELYNHSAANQALRDAIQIFKLIKNKSLEELELGDPELDFKPFYDYFERKLSSTSYRTSAEFKNHEQLLCEQQQEASMLSQFDGISLGEIKQMDDSLDVIVQRLSLAKTPQNGLFFSTPSVYKDPDDTAYRTSAESFLRMARAHLQSGAIKSAVVTYKQAIGALNSMKSPNEQDSQIIEHLTKQIAFLQTKSAQLTRLPITVNEDELSSDSDDEDAELDETTGNYMSC